MTKFIKVAFNDKDKVKELGARWDKDNKSWYIPDGVDESLFKKWEQHDPSQTNNASNNSPKVYLTVPFADKDLVKAAGGRWDSEEKKWYYFSDKDSKPFKKWIDKSSNDKSSSSSTNSNSPVSFSQPTQKEQEEEIQSIIDTPSDELNDFLNL